MNKSLLQGERVRLAAADPDRDSEAMAAWSRDSEFLRLLESQAARPWTTRGMQAVTTELQGKDEPDDTQYPFVIRLLADDRLIGMASLDVAPWPQREAWVAIALGARADWGRGYGTDAMRLLLRYAFAELNLARVSLVVFEYNPRAVRSYLKAGFEVEGRQRERLRRDNRRWDMLFMGILRAGWLNQPAAPVQEA